MTPNTSQTANNDQTGVAVLGLGAMGLPMATRLAGAFTVTGYDPMPASRERAEATGLTCATTAADAVSGAGLVLLAVRDAAQVEGVLFGEDGIAPALTPALTPGAVVVMTSTVGIDAVASWTERLSALGVALVDAPLSGGPVRAGEGDLLIVVGADPAALETARPVLERLASTLTVVGNKAGDGQAMKTVNQLLCGVHIAAAAEALALADALGLDQQLTLATLETGAASSFMLSNRGPRMVQGYDGDADVLSRLDIFVKDLGIVGKAARSAGLAAPVAAAAEQLFLLGQTQGLGTADDSAVIKVVAPRRRTVGGDADGTEAAR
ncbi:NAD(P)-dependent oxidoreductase [Arthrobacter sp. CAL618]|uniref:NAD(P)-dependent oxidoreductase n=1 Tax=Arthrobacter sp. CAL618 TaxID=1055770 RepID=UPI0004203AFA|nr:NAD(P)-dependent oxidoreductase [Arthrobacter sp. CAL618]